MLLNFLDCHIQLAYARFCIGLLLKFPCFRVSELSPCSSNSRVDYAPQILFLFQKEGIATSDLDNLFLFEKVYDDGDL